MSESILFVCTGNICRSPMAEYVARSLSDEVDFASAGTYAMTGGHAWGPAIEAARDEGFDLTPHRARQLSADIAANATVIYALDVEHLDYVTDQFPEAAVDLLDPAGRGIPDPYGQGVAFARTTFQDVADAVRRRFVDG